MKKNKKTDSYLNYFTTKKGYDNAVDGVGEEG